MISKIIYGQGSWMYQLVLNALPAVDTFFFMSGLLSAYISFNQLDKKQFNLGLFYLHRYLRSVLSCLESNSKSLKPYHKFYLQVDHSNGICDCIWNWICSFLVLWTHFSVCTIWFVTSMQGFWVEKLFIHPKLFQEWGNGEFSFIINIALNMIDFSNSSVWDKLGT